jgi:prophage regulatory protein
MPTEREQIAAVPASDSNDSILRIGDVTRRTGLSRVTIWRLERQGEFPGRRQLTNGRSVGWLSSEIQSWISARAAVAPGRTQSAALT